MQRYSMGLAIAIRRRLRRERGLIGPSSAPLVYRKPPWRRMRRVSRGAKSGMLCGARVPFVRIEFEKF